MRVFRFLTALAFAGLAFAVLMTVVLASRKSSAQLEAAKFFKIQPKAERAFLSSYGARELAGLYGIRIEMEPLEFTDPEFERELEPEIILDYLELPSAVPSEVANTRFVPSRRYEGSFYFLAEHNWVDLREIRFSSAEGNSVLATFDCVIHMPTSPPSEYPLVVNSKVEILAPKGRKLGSKKTFDGLGQFEETADNHWTCHRKYHGQEVEVELSADANSFDQLARYAHSVIVEETIPLAKIRDEVQKGLGYLDSKFKQFGFEPKLNVQDFMPTSFYFSQRRHHPEPEVVIVLGYPEKNGHWSLEFTGTGDGTLNWTPSN